MQLSDVTALLQTQEHQFEILKIVVDKGALALLIAMLGAVISLLIERYKSTLTREVELSKITTPMITAMLEANDELFAANCTFIRDCAAEFAEFEAWTRSLLSTRLTIAEWLPIANIPSGADCRSTSVSSHDRSLT